MSKRIEKLMESVRPKKYTICFEMARLIIESFRQTDGEPRIIRAAKAQANILNKMPIFIEPDELIVGNVASEPGGVEALLPVNWSREQIDSITKEEWTISDRDIAEIPSMIEYWKNYNHQTRAIELQDDDRLWPFTQSGVILPPWKTKTEAGSKGLVSSGLGFAQITLLDQDYQSLDYGKIIKTGLNKYIEDAEQELKKLNFNVPGSVNKAYFLQSVIIAHRAMINFAHRFSDLATSLALKEKEPTRKNELERIATICSWIPANPARNFYEAMQFFWFIFLRIVMRTTPMGRFDQFMYTFYEKDIENNRITDEEVLELLQCLRIKDMQLVFTAASAHREKWSGLAKWHNMVIGGQMSDGEDATNKLTYLVLEAARRCQVPHHTVTLRVHDGTPEDLMLKALQLVKTGIGFPAFVGDKSNIENLLTKAVPVKLARDYYINGCIDVNVPEGCGALNPMVATTMAFDLFLHNGVDRNTGKQVGIRSGEFESFATFSDLMDAWKKQLAHCLALEAEVRNLNFQVNKDIFPDTFVASLFTNGIQQGKCRADCPLPYKLGPTMSPVGMINIADSLAAIKKLIFDDNKVTMKQLINALDANWQGNEYTAIRKLFLAAPKYGNDNDCVDSIAKELYQFYADTATTLDHFRGGKYNAAALSISAQWPAGALTGATPDGRHAGDVLADGSMSPVQGMDTKGPIAVIKSASKIDQTFYQSTLFNMKFHPSALHTIEDLRKLSALIKTYFSMGGKHIQFNVVDKETLIDAQKNSEKHHNLLVRVAGYSAYFVQLSKAIQDDVIQRTGFDKIA